MTVKTPVYLDYAATTPVDKRVAEKMIPYLTETFGNPASNSHAFGWTAEEAVEKARADIAALINADPKEIVFTSGATESDNLAIKGAANFYKTKGKHLITVKTEHKAVLDTMRELERQGFEVTYLGVQENGLIDLEELKAAIRDDTILISIMWVNNEIGVVQNIPAIGEICRERKIAFHVDAAQACGKVPVDVEAAKIDLLSMSAHKVYHQRHRRAVRPPQTARPPRSPNARWRSRARFPFRHIADPSNRRHGQGLPHRQRRIGTRHSALPETARHLPQRHRRHRRSLYQRRPRTPRPEQPERQLQLRRRRKPDYGGEELAVSSGSACTSASLEPSYVLRALRSNDELAHSSLRITFGRMTTEEEVQFAAELIKSKIGKLRELSPLWEMFKDGIDLNSIEWAAH